MTYSGKDFDVFGIVFGNRSQVRCPSQVRAFNEAIPP
jgi:hypothetical protein